MCGRNFILQYCSGLLITGEERKNLLKQVSNPSLDYLRRKALHKKIVALSKKVSVCLHCGRKNGKLNILS